MALVYHKLLPRAFKRFSILSAFHTALPTAWYYVRRPLLPESPKPALCTMNIFPPLARVWWHFAKRVLDDRADVFIFDCSGKLDPRDFEGAHVQKFLNFYAATKCQEFFCHTARTRDVVWMCDDDMFLLSSTIVDHVEEAFKNSNAKPRTEVPSGAWVASVSFRPRGWWEFSIDGKRFPVSSSYCTAVNRNIFMEEHLSLSPIRGNPHPSTSGKQPKSYDTFDKANEILLQKGYECRVPPKDIREECVAGFSGISNGVMILNYFRTSQQMIEYLTSPSKKQWEGSVLPTVFGALLAISAVLDLEEEIMGKRTAISSLPSKEDLRQIRSDHEHLLMESDAWRRIDATVERLCHCASHAISSMELAACTYRIANIKDIEDTIEPGDLSASIIRNSVRNRFGGVLNEDALSNVSTTSPEQADQ